MCRPYSFDCTAVSWQNDHGPKTDDHLFLTTWYIIPFSDYVTDDMEADEL